MSSVGTRASRSLTSRRIPSGRDSRGLCPAIDASKAASTAGGRRTRICVVWILGGAISGTCPRPDTGSDSDIAIRSTAVAPQPVAPRLSWSAPGQIHAGTERNGRAARRARQNRQKLTGFPTAPRTLPSRAAAYFNHSTMCRTITGSPSELPETGCAGLPKPRSRSSRAALIFA